MANAATQHGKQVFIAGRPVADASIYHCTPMTPRAALEAIGIDRNFCVSFWRPDDTEVVERIASTVMFRQRRVQRVAVRNESRAGMVRAGRLVTVLSVVGAAAAWQPLGDHTGCTWSAFPAQRRAVERLAVRGRTRGPGLAHGRPGVSPAAALRSVPPRVHGLDRHRSGQGGRVHGVVRAHVGDCAGTNRTLAANPSLARRLGGAGISLCECGREQRRAERVAI